MLYLTLGGVAAFPILIDHRDKLPRLIRLDPASAALEREDVGFTETRKCFVRTAAALVGETDPLRDLAGVIKPNVPRVVADSLNELIAFAHGLILHMIAEWLVNSTCDPSAT